ncbi:aliphatic sulfonate ABC transporter substrate-binding protein [Salinarimonas sp. NSM]|uniref:aliphatic sulfonate ABC transporter substrate-binding protein n=1 Tax=Salinarimonas sp. NSM TaxID=3458003 RepID=UPI0040366525
MTLNRRTLLAALGAGIAAPFVLTNRSVAQDAPGRITVDYATYNPVSLLLRERGWLEEALAADGIDVRWVQTLGSNKALEFLNAEAIDFGSTAGAAALVGRLNGNPIRTIYLYSRPEWTALVTRPDTGIETVADLAGRRVAVTRGTDPHIFLVRALAGAGLTERDVRLVLLQHPDGRLALERGDVDAWAGLDPMMAAAELESGAKLFHRDPGANTFGTLNVRESFAQAHPRIVETVLAAYERARTEALADPAALAAVLGDVTRLPPEIVARQLERTDITNPVLGTSERETIRAAGVALVEAGVLPAGSDIDATLDALIDSSFTVAAR